MKKLIIHNNNTFLSDPIYFKIEDQFVFEFDKDNSEIDKIMHQQINVGELNDKIINADILFIKISLSRNYLEYLGLRLAYHIRLTPELKEKSRIPIIFIAEETLQFIGITSSMPSLLNTKGIYVIQDNIIAFNKMMDLVKNKRLKISDNITFLKKTLYLPSPSNYSSHHSIENELALLCWSQYIGCYKDLPLDKFDFLNTLYYKLNKMEVKIKEKRESFIDDKSSGKILLIDDEAAKGWNVFYNTLFQKAENIKFFKPEISFVNRTKSQIIEDLKNRIHEVNPDLVLLDIRLCEEDFDDNLAPNKLSGYLIAEITKELNKGIQIIITSASNKVWNFSIFEKFGSIEYLIKSSSLDIEKQFKEFALSIKNKLRQSRFLKSVFSKIKFISQQLNESSSQSYFGNEFQEKTKNHLITSFALLEKSFNDPVYMNHAYLQAYFILEDFTNSEEIFIEGSNECSVVVDNETRIVVLIKKEILKNKSIIYESAIVREKFKYTLKKSESVPIYGRLNMDLKMHLILYFRYGGHEEAIRKWGNLNRIRNSKAGHSASEGIVSQRDLLEVLEFIQFVFDSKNINIKNKNKSLKASLDEKKNALLEKFNNSINKG